MAQNPIPSVKTVPLRLPPGTDLRATLEAGQRAAGPSATFVLAGIGSLSQAQLRFAGRTTLYTLQGDIEILTLAGTIAANGAHLHISVADADGRVWGGHVAPGCLVRTTAEILIVELPDWNFSRELDPTTGFPELVIRGASPTAWNQPESQALHRGGLVADPKDGTID